ncbi:vomeronasal 1 receptor monDomV1R1292 [Monodelphis domestica]|uniref:Vomeronasal type-1 receptor n=1 Tax=Monodelphis domestica TaxID=13616 RepID=H9H658_MONDO|nr:vomeronasal 1 receptor monDomV1R1292 [Monodelphis domestica]
MIHMDMLLRIAFFSQTVIGLQGNFFLIFLFTFMFFTGQRLRSIDLILAQLALANSLVLLFKAFPQGLAALGMKNFLDDIGCKIVFYLHRVARGLSLSMTCILSGLQAIIISPNNTMWIVLKARVPKYIISSSVLSWIFHMLQNIIVLENLQGPRGTRNISGTKEHGYCSINVANDISASIHAIVFSFPDAVLMAFISFTSGYKIYLLQKHHKRVQQMHTVHFATQAFPEARATKMILLLVSIFVTFYLLNAIMTAYMHSMTLRPWMLHSSAFMSSFFPMVSPFVLISSDSQIRRYYNAVHGRRSPHTETYLDLNIFSCFGQRDKSHWKAYI